MPCALETTIIKTGWPHNEKQKTPEDEINKEVGDAFGVSWMHRISVTGFSTKQVFEQRAQRRHDEVEMDYIEEQGRRAKAQKHTEALRNVHRDGAERSEHKQIASHGEGPESNIRRVFDNVEEGCCRGKVRVFVGSLSILRGCMQAILREVAYTQKSGENKNGGKDDARRCVADGNSRDCPLPGRNDAAVEKSEDSKGEPCHRGEVRHDVL